MFRRLFDTMKIPIDKQAHIIAGAAIAAALLPFGIIPALLAVVVAAVGKELWDAQWRGTPDHIDALATCIGGVLMLGWLHLAPLITEIF